MLTAFYTFWFRPHLFYTNLVNALKKKDNKNSEAFYINSLWLGTFIILAILCYPYALLFHRIYQDLSVLAYVGFYFLGALVMSIVYALFSYYAVKNMTRKRNDPGWIILNYNSLFGHAIVTSHLIMVYIPITLFLALLELFFHSQAMDIISGGLMLTILRMFPKFFVAQAMHENNQRHED